MIRLATPSDHNEIFRLLQQFYHEAPHRKYAEFNADIVHSHITEFLQAPKLEKIVFLAEDVKPFGLLAAGTVPVFFSLDVKRAYEIAWYVEEDKRHKRDAIRLLDAYEYWAKQVGCKSIQVATMINPRLGEFYEKRGFHALETSYIKDLRHGN